MSENILKEILLEVHKIEYGVDVELPDYKPSLRHRLAMKHIFARYERNVQKLKEKSSDTATHIEHNKPRPSFKQRLIIITVIVILMTLLVGWVVVFVSGNFRGTVYPDKTHLAVTDIEVSPQTIEYKYALVSVPKGFEMIETSTSPIHVYTLYMNNLTEQTIVVHQWVKSSYETNFNTENYVFEDVIIDGRTGLCIDFSDDKQNSFLIVWDNGDYIIEIIADIDKNDAINLSKIDKV